MGRKWAWASLAITSMWLAVLFTALFAPSLVATSAAGDTTKVPVAAIVVATVAFIGTIVVAIVGFKDGTPADLELERERLERARLEAKISELETRLGARNETHGRAHALFGR